MASITDGGYAPAAASGANESSRSAVSWPAVIAGAVVAAATSLVLVALGSGLGFASLSPWPGGAPSPAQFAIGAGIWLVVTQWLASAAGGYLTGRLRTRWAGTHTHEVFFRDTAHGFLAWSLATLLVAALVTAAGVAAVGSTANAAGSSIAYGTDTLMRTTKGPEAGSGGATRDEVGRILARSVGKGGISADDKAYLANTVAARTGVTPAEASARVDATVNTAREAADGARKTSAATAIFTALSMVIGAFIASVAAALGGGLRDEHA